MVNNFRLGLKTDDLKHIAYKIPYTINADSIIVDIGANIGSFMLELCKDKNNVFFFEASYENYLKCLENLKINGLKHVGFNLAVSNETGKISYLKSHNNKDHGSNSLIENHYDWSTNKQPVLTISLDDIFHFLDVDRINYLKCDIECSEYDFLMNKDLSKIDYLAIELHKQLGYKRDDLLEYILKYFDIVDENIWDHYEILFRNKNSVI